MEKYFVNVLRIKLKLDVKEAIWTYSFLEDLARFILCESYILSSNKDFFKDFINLQKEHALKEFENYYGIVIDYDFNVDQVAKGGKFFTNLICDFDTLLIRYYWQSIVKGKSNKELKHHLLDISKRILVTMFNVDVLMERVYQDALKMMRKTIVKDFLKSTNLTKKNYERLIENFLALPVTSFTKLIKTANKSLGKLDENKIKQMLGLEAWLFQNKFRNSLQLILTNGFSLNHVLLDNFLKMAAFLNKKFNNTNDEEFLELIYAFRKEVLFKIDEGEGRFYNDFISKYEVSFKHKGTYSITYLEEQNRIIQNNLIKYNSVKAELHNSGREYLADQVRKFRKKSEHYATILKRKAIKERILKKYKVLVINDNIPLIVRKKLEKLERKKVKIKPLRLLEMKIRNDESKYKSDIRSILLGLRRATVFFHIFVKNQNYKTARAQFLFDLFLIIVIDSIMTDKYENNLSD